MNRRTWMACLGLLVAAGVGTAQMPPVPGTPQAAGTPEPAASPAPAVVAVVGGVPIGMADLEAALKQADPMPVQRTGRGQTQHRLRVLGTLIDEALMRKFLEANTKPVDPAEVQRRLAEMEAELREKDRSLAEFCLETRKTVDQLKADIADRLRWSKYEAEKLTDATLAQCYNRNKDFFDGVTVRASHIVVRVSPGASEAEKAAAREKLLGLRKRLREDPKLDFDELAKNQPDKGGDLESIPRRWFDEQFSRAAYALPPGEVSDIVQTDFGMHLIKVTERRPGKATETEKIHRAVRECCAEELRQKILAHQRKTVEVKVNLP